MPEEQFVPGIYKFTEFVEKIYKPNITNLQNSLNVKHIDIDYKKIEQYTNKLQQFLQKPFLEYILNPKKINIIQFNTFLVGLKTTIDAYLKFVGDNKSVIILPSVKIKKSNFWICLLMINYLLEKNAIKNFEYVYIGTNDSEYKNFIQADNNKYFALIPDDGSYSGAQMIDALINIKQLDFKFICPMLHFVTNKSIEVLNRGAKMFGLNAKVKIFYKELVLNIPLNEITDLTLHELLKYLDLKIPNNNILIDVLKYHIKAMYSCMYIFETQTNTLFAHKLADSVSIPIFFYNYLPKITISEKFYDIIKSQFNKSSEKLQETLTDLEEKKQYSEYENILPCQASPNPIIKLNLQECLGSIFTPCQNKVVCQKVNESNMADIEDYERCYGTIYKQINWIIEPSFKQTGGKIRIKINYK